MSSLLPHLASFAAPPTRGTALLADDEPTIRRLGELLLRQLGFAVLTAADGREAVELFARHHADVRVVMLDLSMPRLSGVGALAAIRTRDATVPVILCSGSSDATIPPEVITAAHVHFLPKPFPMREFQRIVNAAVSAS